MIISEEDFKKAQQMALKLTLILDDLPKTRGANIINLSIAIFVAAVAMAVEGDDANQKEFINLVRNNALTLHSNGLKRGIDKNSNVIKTLIN